MKEEEDLKRLRELQQQAQVLLLQKQNIQLQQSEIQNAIKELESTKEKEVYELVGNILIKKNKEDIIPKLKDANETLQLRASAMDKQLDILTKKIVSLQEKYTKK